MRHIVRSLLLGTAAVLIQWLLLGRLQMWGAYPDLALLIVAWIALRYGRLGGSAAGFFVGFAMDVVYGSWGVHMFAKTLVGFLVGLFVATERESLISVPQQAFLAAFVTALLQNGILVILIALQSGTRMLSLVSVLWLGCSAYTGLLGLILSLFRARVRLGP